MLGLQTRDDLLRAARDAAHRRKRTASDAAAHRSADRDAHGGHREEDQEHAVEDAVDFVERARHLRRTDLPEPDRQHT